MKKLTHVSAALVLLPQLCYKSTWLSCFGGFFFLWTQSVFSLYFSVPVLMEHSSQEFDAAILDHCEKNIKAFFFK